MLQNAYRRLRDHALTLTAAVAVAGLTGCAGDQSIQKFSAQSNAELLQKPDVQVRVPEVKAYVKRLAEEVLAAGKEYRQYDAQKDGWIYDKLDAVVVLDPNPNAFVTGDDIVFVHSGLIRELEHPDQLVAVLTHELSHNEKRHIKSNIDHQGRQVGLGLLAVAGAVAGAATGYDVGYAIAGGAGAVSAVDGMATMSFNKAEEMEADREGLALFREMGYDPKQFRRVFEILKEKFGDGTGLSSHPKNSERIAQVAKLAEQPLASGRKPELRTQDLAEFKRIQAIVAQLEKSASGKAFVGDAKYRNRLMSCFDYCHVKPKTPQKQK